MILADKILNLRKKNGWSQEELADKLNVSRQSISKWEGAIAIPDINKIIDMAKLFSVTTDYLLKDDVEDAIYTSDDNEEKVRKVSIDEANGFMHATKSYCKQIAFGVLLCIISPTLLIFLAGLSEYNNVINEEIACALGLIFLFVAVAAAVLIFILTSAKLKKYEFFEKEKFELEYGVEGIVKEKKEKFMTKFNVLIAVSVSLIILAVLPLVITSILMDNDFLAICMTVLLLVLVAVAVFIIVNICITKSTYDQILSEDDYSKQYKESNKTSSRFGGFYWPIVTAGYLCWSFISNDWHITWIVWPIAGLIFAGISALLHTENK